MEGWRTNGGMTDKWMDGEQMDGHTHTTDKGQTDWQTDEWTNEQRLWLFELLTEPKKRWYQKHFSELKTFLLCYFPNKIKRRKTWRSQHYEFNSINWMVLCSKLHWHCIGSADKLMLIHYDPLFHWIRGMVMGYSILFYDRIKTTPGKQLKFSIFLEKSQTAKPRIFQWFWSNQNIHLLLCS